MTLQEISNEEWRAVQEMRAQRRDERVRNDALECAAILADRWADEGGGGGYRNLAVAIRRLKT